MDLLEQLVFEGKASKDFEKVKGKIKFTLQTITGKQQLNIENEMKSIKGNPTFIVHKYSLKMLSNGLTKYQDKDFSDKNPEEVEEFLSSLSTTIVDMLSDAQTDFQRECKEVLTTENLENLSETQPTDSV